MFLRFINNHKTNASSIASLFVSYNEVSVASLGWKIVFFEILVAISRALTPEILTIEIEPIPLAVAIATIVASSNKIKFLLLYTH